MLFKQSKQLCSTSEVRQLYKCTRYSTSSSCRPLPLTSRPQKEPRSLRQNHACLVNSRLPQDLLRAGSAFLGNPRYERTSGRRFPWKKVLVHPALDGFRNKLYLSKPFQGPTAKLRVLTAVLRCESICHFTHCRQQLPLPLKGLSRYYSVTMRVNSASSAS